MKRVFLLYISLFSFYILEAQEARVPSEMRFGDIRLKLNEAARKEIQEDVDAITQSPRYLNVKVERAQLYFPIIERILAEEKVPVDIKYLAIQESALIPDAVSSSNAVGYWQFKDFTAIEMGLRVDNHIDERMNIVSATRAAAKYFKKNNFYFDNWIYALQAYQMGAGAAMKVVDEKVRGANSVNITKKTYWYVKKYLAHKVAYEHALLKAPQLDQQLIEYSRGGSKTLRNIASELSISEEDLEPYNKWLKRGKIPEDKAYAVIIPVGAGDAPQYIAVGRDESTQPDMDEGVSSGGYDGIEDPDRFPEISEKKRLASRGPLFVSVNGIEGILGKEGQTPSELAELAKITELKFRSYNEILPHESIIDGQVYYFKKKKTKAKAHYHTIQYGETLWSISQKYGLRMSKLIKKNRLNNENEIKPGMVLWLRYIRPSSEPILYREVTDVIIASENNDKNTDTEPLVEEIVEEEADNGPVVVVSEPDIEIEEKQGIEIPEEVGSEESENMRIIHEVEAKETLYAISKTYGVEVMDIVTWNSLNLADGLRIGQVLEIWVAPNWREKKVDEDELTVVGEEKDDGEFVEHRVQPGDTLYAIASRYNVSIEDIQKWNNKDEASVTIGEIIRIKR